MIFSPSVGAGASNGEGVVLVGRDTLDCFDDQPVVWRSLDGRLWERAADLPRPTGWLDAVWPVSGGGWEALWLGDGAAVWRSDDGLLWHEVVEVAPQDRRILRLAAAVGPNGTRLLSIFGDGPGVTSGSALLTSPDGANWSQVRWQPDGEWSGEAPLDWSTGSAVVDIVAPSASRGAWLVLREHPVFDHPFRRTLWTSTDLATWQELPLPGPDSSILGSSSHGLLLAVYDDGGSTLYIGDGDSWHALEPGPIPPVAVADGPAGLIAVEYEDRGYAWRLEP